MMIFTASTIYNDGTITSKLYVADSDGRNQKLLSEVTGRDVIKAGWSPKGDKITFIENGNLYTINPDGSGRATIALTPSNYAWHPSGDYIAFSADIDKKTGKDVDHSRFWPKEDSYITPVFIAKPDGTERVQITPNDSLNKQLGGWSPDGSRLLVNSFDKTDLLVIKFSGYNEVMSLYVPSSVQLGEEFAIQVKSMSKPVENATIFLNSKTNENGFIFLNGMEIGKTNESGFLKYSFKEAGNLRLSAVKQGFRTANKSITVQESPSGQSSPEPTVTATQQSVTAAVTPKAPGFDAVLAIGILSAIYLFKRRYN